MSKRIYNIMFHTHTISGIVISAALYVIFFAGSFSFFRDEIIAWERNEPVNETYFSEVNFDELLKKINEEHPLGKRNINIYQRIEGQTASVYLAPSKDTLAPKEKGRRNSYFATNLTTHSIENYRNNYSLGEFFYRLHFFAQLNFFGRSGYFLAGFIAFFFLFAVVTGVIVHWKKIVSSFYVFRPKQKLKTIWTDAHVALGFIGLPYQFMFAVTGCYLIIGYMVMLPPVKSIMYNDDDKEFNKVLTTEVKEDYNYEGTALEGHYSINDLVLKTQKEWPNVKLNGIEVYNYSDANMHVKISGRPKYKQKLLGSGFITYRVKDQLVVNKQHPTEKVSYVDGAVGLIQRLHFGDFGGYGMKLIYFALGLITCFVIISGVLIWLVARQRKNVPEYKQKFNLWLVNIYMAICLSMYPITAFIFVAVKFWGNDFEGGKRTFIYQVFFWGWLLLSSFFIIKKDYYFTNKICLLLGAVIGFLVPISNGIVTGNWLWVSWHKNYNQVFVFDVFWVLLSITSLLVYLKIKRK
ncbi:PepSY-associated TM helix domain-containing protein [Wenyingzhuangia sp. IMCC45467]